MIDYECPRCGESMQSPDSRVGGTESCPNCRKAVEVPSQRLLPEVSDGEEDDFEEDHEYEDNFDDNFEDDFEGDSKDDCEDDFEDDCIEKEEGAKKRELDEAVEGDYSPTTSNSSSFARSASGAVAAIAVITGVVAFFISWAGGFVLHVWTAYLYYPGLFTNR